jgi:hypothetical protein
MKYATKLSLNIDTSSLREEDLTRHQMYFRPQKYSRNHTGFPVPSFTLGIDNGDEFIDQLPTALLALERPSVFVLELPAVSYPSPTLPAHVDLNRTCGINVYLEANGEVTNFYTWDQETKTATFDEHFCSDVGEAWLMNTTVPHEVKMITMKRRRALTFSFTKAKYEEVLGAL